MPAIFPPPLAGVVNRLLKIDELERFYQSARGASELPGELLRRLDVRADVAESDLARIPESGPVVALSNHPFGLLDGVMLTELLLRRRTDVRILATGMLGAIPELAQLCFFVDPFGNPSARLANGRALRDALTHLRNGGLLLIFPSGEVSHFDPRCAAVRDPQWHPTAARLVRMTRAKSVPILVDGANSLGFQLLGLLHARLRTAALPAEFLNKRGRAVRIRIGSPVSASRLAACGSDEAATSYLRGRCEWLARRDEPCAAPPVGCGAPVEPTDLAGRNLSREVAALPPVCHLVKGGGLEVYVAEAARIPAVLREIGRLREITFRAAGEGTGNPIDLDRFDQHYLHVFLWNPATQEVIGAYRMGDVPQILLRHGVTGLYTSTQFRFAPDFFRRHGPALELGRSFVRTEYQRQFLPLALLWRGICTWIARRPEYAILFGAVSISGRYSRSSRELISDFFARSRRGQTAQVRPRRPLHIFKQGNVIPVGATPLGMDDLSDWISEIEGDRKGLPVLVKQYSKMGGRILAFSVDPHFGNTLDGFVLMDLRRAPVESLQRHMGAEDAAAFLAWHGESVPTHGESVPSAA